MSERETVVPGELIAKGKKPGENAYEKNGNIYASIYGFKETKENRVDVLPAKTKYVPKEKDKVMGIIKELNFNNWLLDINCPYDAKLPISEHPAYVETGELESHLEISDTVIVEITEVDKEMNVTVKMDEDDLRKLEGGRLVEISPSKVPRVIGKNASMISMLKRESNCDIYVSQNGRIWIKGTKRNMEEVSEAIKLIEKKAHTSGLTDRIKNFLKE